jgi:hypothetical protein
MRTLFFLQVQIPHELNADERALDDALSCTFPASDPVAITFHFPFIKASVPTEISQR